MKKNQIVKVKCIIDPSLQLDALFLVHAVVFLSTHPLMLILTSRKKEADTLNRYLFYKRKYNCK